MLRPSLVLTTLLIALFLPPAQAQFSLFGPAGLPDAQRFSVVLETGDVAKAREWLDAGLDPNFEGHLIGTGLMIGAWEGNIPMMELFLARGADIHRTNRFGETALMHAAWKNRREAMQWLLARGAKPNRSGKEWSPLHYAAFAGHAELVDDLIQSGADVNARSTNGSTVIMMAAREGHAQVSQRLLEAGANPAIRNDYDEDAVAWAMRQGNYSIAKSYTSAENFAALSRDAERLRAPVRSIPVPNVVEEYLRMARFAEAQGKRDEAAEAYRKAFAAIKAQEAPRKDGKTKTAGRPAPSAMVISARRDAPDKQSLSLTPAPVQAPAPTASPAATGDSVDQLLAQARAAEAAGRRQEALRLYRQASASLKSGRE